MKSWKEHPHLFANGKFKVRAGKSGEIVEVFKPYINDTDGRFYHKAFSVETECTLIARRIENLTEAELRKILQADGFQDEGMNRAIDEGRTDIVLEFVRSSFEGALELLDRGVYPGPQSDFGKTVIDINEV